jgi:C4-dicarboxylate-specific signal transduction histidine kinase
MKGRDQLSLQIEQDSESVRINVSDSGKVHKNHFKTVFEPGFTTKSEVGD